MSKKVRIVKAFDADMNPELHAFVPGRNGDVAGFVLASPNAAAAPTAEIKSDQNLSSEFQSWGSDNLTPYKWRMKLEKSSTALPLIAKKIYMNYGRGLTYYLENYEGDQMVPDYTRIQEVDDFLNANDIEYLMLERLWDMGYLNNLFAEYILSGDGSKIVNVYHLEAEFTRFGKIDEKTSKISNILYDGDWSSPKSKLPIPFISRRDLNPDNIKAVGKKFASHDCMPSPGRTLYAIPAHVAIYRDNGWLDYANAIPEIMNSINKNVMDLKWHIRIPYEYWGKIHKGWEQLTQKQRDKVIQDKLKEMTDWLQGEKNSGKAFISHFATDEITGKPMSGWEIIELNSSDKKDKYLTSVQEADTQVTRALLMDSSLASIQPASGKMGAGSGSDKRVAHENAVSISHAELSIITHPLKVIGNYNGWPANLKWVFVHEVPTSLNENKSGTKTI